MTGNQDQSKAPHVKLRPEQYDDDRGGPFHQRRLEAIVSAITTTDSHWIADLGCGTGMMCGAVAKALPNCQFTGVDLEPKLITFAKSHHGAPNVTYRAGDATKPDEGTFDFIYSLDFIHHLPDQAKAVQQIGLGLRPGGHWMIIEPNLWYPMAAIMQEQMKRRGMGEDHFFPKTAEKAIRLSGLRIVQKTYMHLLPAIPAISVRWPAFERRVEQIPVLGASVVYLLERPSPNV